MLALLALRLGKPVDRLNLASTVWPDSETPDALYSLRRTLTDIRQALGSAGAAITATSPSTIQLDRNLVDVDLIEFESLILKGDEESIALAVQLYRGSVLSEWRFDWVVLERAIRERSLLEALLRQSDRAEERGDNLAAAEALRLLSSLDPHDESIFQRLMTNLARGGNLSGAQRAFDEFKRRLRTDLEIQPSERTLELAKDLLAAVPKVVDRSRFVGGNLPLPTSPLVGRKLEIALTLQALDEGRMVTLVGSGGVGKTRLAMEVMREVAAARAHRAIAVDLLAVRDADHLYEAFATATKGIDTDPTASPSQIVSRLVDSDAIILLDNCEHLLEPVKYLAQELLDHCPKLRILATSQARLGASNETIIRISPMHVPKHMDISFTQAKQNDAVSLMTQCISKAKGGFELTERNFRSVCRICETLEGVPLALELAATRTRLMSIDQVSSLLEDRFRLLRTTDRGIEERHRTLQATMDWSYSLLSEREQDLLQTVSVFAGYWSSESAAKVHDRLDAYEILEVLERLIDRSLVFSDPSEELPRFRLLDSVRQYASDRLAERGLLEECRDRHLFWFTELTEAAEKGFPGKDQRYWLDRISAEYENIPSAFSWARHSPDLIPYALRMTSSLMRYWWTQGELTTGREMITRALEMGKGIEDTRAYAKALYTAGTLAWSQGDNRESEELQKRSLSIFKASNDLEGAAGCYRNLCQSVRNQGRLEEALEYGRRALEGYQQVGNQLLEAFTLTDLGIAAFDLLKFEEASDYLKQAIQFSFNHGITSLEAVALLNYGAVQHLQGLMPEAKQALERALLVFEQSGGRIMSIMTRNALALVFSDLGDIERAKELASSSFDTFLELGEKKGICLTLETVASIAFNAGELVLATSLIGTADQMRSTLEFPLAPAETPGYQKQIGKIQNAIGPDEFADAYLEGQSADQTMQVNRANNWIKSHI